MPDGATEHHLEVRRTARFWTAGRRAEGASEVWIVLHGYRQLARRFLARFDPLLDGPSRLLVAPEGLSRFYVAPGGGRHGPEAVVGASWMTREDRDHEIGDYVAYLDGVARAVLQDGDRLTVLGFSQGAATATRWAALGTIRPERLVLWGGLLPHDLDLQGAEPALSDTELVLVAGEQDPSFDVARVELEAGKLVQVGLRHRAVLYDGGHEIDPTTLAVLAEGGREAGEP